MAQLTNHKSLCIYFILRKAWMNEKKMQDLSKCIFMWIFINLSCKWAQWTAPVATCLLSFDVSIFQQSFSVSMERATKKLNLWSIAQYGRGGVNVQETLLHFPFYVKMGTGEGDLPRVFIWSEWNYNKANSWTAIPVYHGEAFPSQPFVSGSDRPQLLF